MRQQGAKSDPPGGPPDDHPTIKLPREEFDWAKARAEREGTTVSVVVTEAVRKARQLEARREVLAWLDEGQTPLTAQELEAVDNEWQG